MKNEVNKVLQAIQNGDDGFPTDINLPEGWTLVDGYEKEDLDFHHEELGILVEAQVWSDFGQIINVLYGETGKEDF